MGKRERGGSAPKKKTLNLAWNFVKRSADSHDDCLSLSSVPACFRRVESRMYRDCKREKPRCMIMNIWMNNDSEIGGMIKGYYRWQCHPQRNAFLTNLKRERARKHIPYASSSRCYAPHPKTDVDISLHFLCYQLLLGPTKLIWLLDPSSTYVHYPLRSIPRAPPQERVF